MSYKVSITKIETVPAEAREWVKLAETGSKVDNGPFYGYATYPSTTRQSVTVLEQEVAELDLKAVIKAINGL